MAFESYSEGVKLYLKVFERQVAAFESHHKGAPHFIPRNPPEHKSPKWGLHHVAILSSMWNIMWWITTGLVRFPNCIVYQSRGWGPWLPLLPSSRVNSCISRRDPKPRRFWCDNCDASAKLKIIVIPAHPALSHRWSSEQLSNPLSRTTECNLLAASICQRFHRSIWSTRHQRGSWKCSIVLTKHVQSHRYTCQRDSIQIFFVGGHKGQSDKIKKKKTYSGQPMLEDIRAWAKNNNENTTMKQTNVQSKQKETWRITHCH